MWQALFWARNRRYAGVVRSLGTGLRILDLGCGEAEFSRFLSTENTIYGCDIASTPLKQARRYVCHAVVANAEAADLPFVAGSFDAVLLMETLYYLRDPAACFAAVRRVLKPSGFFVLSAAVANDPSQWRGWLTRRLLGRRHQVTTRSGQTCTSLSYSTSEISSLLGQAGFRIVRVASFLAGVPLLMNDPRWLSLQMRLGEFYPMLAKFRLFVARPIPDFDVPDRRQPHRSVARSAGLTRSEEVLGRSGADLSTGALRALRVLLVSGLPAFKRLGPAWTVFRGSEDALLSLVMVALMIVLSPYALVSCLRRHRGARTPDSAKNSMTG